MTLSKLDTHSLDFYTSLLASLPGLVVVMDLNSQFICSNKYTANAFGYKNEDHMLGINAYGMRCPAVNSAKEFLLQDQKVIQTGAELAMLDIHVYAGKKHKVLLTKKTPLQHHGETVGVICHCTELNSNLITKITGALIKADRQYFNKKKGDNRSYLMNATLDESPLTKRELDCIFYLLRGKSAKEIGAALHLSPRTVEHYIENMKSKILVQKKSDLIEYALEKGLINYIPSKLIAKDISICL